MYKLKHYAVAVGPLCSIKGRNNGLATLHKMFYIDLRLGIANEINFHC